MQLNGTTAGAGYDQLNVTGTVDLSSLGSGLTGTAGFTPVAGTTFTIINNDGTDPVVGTFAGKPEGSTITLSGLVFSISYVGGTGNDVVLTMTAPRVTNVSSTTANGTYGQGAAIAVRVTFSAAVTVTGTPQLTLETGASDAVVNYTSGSGSTTLTFNYTVAAGHTSADLDYISTGALVLNGGTIRDAGSNDAVLTLATPGAAGSLGANKNLVIDGTAPTVTNVTSSTADGTYAVGATVSIQVVFSEAVTVTGTPQLTLETGASDAVVNYTSGSGTNTLTFTYTVGAGHTSADLDYVATTSLALNGGSIVDAVSNAATLTLASPGAAGSLGTNKNLVIDGAVPTVTTVTSSTADGTYGVGATVSVQVTFSEAVTVTGTPQLTLETGASDAVVNYASGSGTNTLTFTYTVAAGHTSADLDYISTGALALNGGTILDAATNAATLTLASPGAAGSLGANKALVLNSPPTATAVTITGTAAVGQLLTGSYTYGDVDTDAEGTSTFRWLRNGVAIGGATALTYTPVPADAGTTLTFEVTPVAATGTSPGTPATATLAIGNSAPTATAVAITGTGAVGQLLTGSYTYGDVDTDAEGLSTFRWLRNGTPIGGATALTYTTVPADAGTTVTFEVTPVAATGTSPGTPATATLAIGNSAPTATAVAITGTAAVGQLLTGSYTYGDVDTDAEGTSTFRWLRNGVAIGGATALTYTTVPADAGTTLTFEVTPVAATGTSPGTPATATLAIGNSAPTATAVAITGTAAVGQLLTGSYTYGDVDTDAEGTSTFRWLRNGVAIGGATALTYTTVPADAGTTLTFEITPVAATGTSPGTPATATLAIGNSAPTATAVAITGTAAVGQLLTGSYTYGDVDTDAEGTSTFRWLRNGVAIGGATALTYTTVPADAGTTLTFEITPVAATGTSPGTPATATLAIGNSAPTATAVAITGTAAVGQLLTGSYTYGDVDTDAEGTSTFRWLRNGVAIGGATALTYTTVPADAGTTLTFEVTPVAATGTSPGTPATATLAIGNSAPTATAVTITGTAAVGQLLTGSYTYGDVDTEVEGTSTFRLAAQRRGDWRGDGADLHHCPRGCRDNADARDHAGRGDGHVTRHTRDGDARDWQFRAHGAGGGDHRHRGGRPAPHRQLHLRRRRYRRRGDIHLPLAAERRRNWRGDGADLHAGAGRRRDHADV